MTKAPDDSSRRAWLAAERGAFVVIALLVVAMLAIFWTRLGSWRVDPLAPATRPDDAYLDRVDPNAANWQTLACLPGIGEQRAKAIVAYRSARRSPAFTQPDDLMNIRGIGPKTLDSLRPFLVFPTTQPE
jgi:DNA uptake protein ComE-like DNA-binding protein